MKLYAYGKTVNSHDVLKALAMVAMFADHAGFYFWPQQLWLRACGRLAAPLFFFLIGYTPRYQFKWPLLLGGLWLLALHAVLTQQFFADILLNFVIVRAFLQALKPAQMATIPLLLLFLGFVLLMPFTYTRLGYGSLGWMFAVVGHLKQQQDARMLPCLAVTLLSYFIDQQMVFGFYSLGQQFILAGVCAVIAVLILQYHHRLWATPAGVRWPILLLSRYSLEIYIAHVTALKVYAARAIIFN